MSALRLLEMELTKEGGDGWWLHPPWNPGKTRASVLDVERLLADWLGSAGDGGG